jgi:mannonate dehydratase
VIEDNPPMDKLRLGAAGREAELEDVLTLISNMGRLGIPVLCYHWMVVLGWLRTSVAIPARGGALVSAYDHALLADAPMTATGEVSEDQLWDSLEWFLQQAVPVAEEAGVKLALHPDDPPLSPIRGVARIMRTVDAFQRAIDLVPSEANGITLCQGNFALMTSDLPAAIRHFGKQQRIHFVHFRDVAGDPEAFVETFHDDGPTDMLECLHAYRDVGYSGVLRTDHVPLLEGDTAAVPGYSWNGRIYAVGYIKGLLEGVYR